MRDRAKSAGRALDILSAISASPTGVAFADLVDELELPKSSVFEVLDVLLQRRFVQLDPETRRYTLAVRAWEVGSRYLGQHELAAEAQPFMKVVVQELNETVQLAVLDGMDNVYIGKVDCTHPVRLQSAVGKRLPAHATGLGKALLAALPDDELGQRLDRVTLAGYTSRTITDRTRLEAQLADIRREGFAVDDQEYTPGLRCVAVPVRDHRGATVAALSASVPMMRAHISPLWKALTLVAMASIRISERVGASGEDSVLRGLTVATHAKGAIARAFPDGSRGAAAMVAVAPVGPVAQP
ncbi:MAG: IclR family transcriptional regulator [Chloroflexi bacterium]|nr:IclR family transcriptional regulator [Chloroflexota bacterium]